MRRFCPPRSRPTILRIAPKNETIAAPALSPLVRHCDGRVRALAATNPITAWSVSSASSTPTPLHHTVTVSATPTPSSAASASVASLSVSPHQFASPSSASNLSPRARERGGRAFLDADGGTSTATTAAVVAAGGPPSPRTRPTPTSAHRLRTRRRTATRPAVGRAVLQGTGAHCPPQRRCGRIVHSPQRSTACHCALRRAVAVPPAPRTRVPPGASPVPQVAAASPHSTSSSPRVAGGSGSAAGDTGPVGVGDAAPHNVRRCETTRARALCRPSRGAEVGDVRGEALQ
jgi:hypothetical protein